jgi:hypothetical protein
MYEGQYDGHRKAIEVDAGSNDLLLKVELLTTPFAIQNSPKAACDFYWPS